MADTKPTAFPTLGTVADSTELYTQTVSDNFKFSLSTLWTYIRGKLNGGSQSVANGGSIAINQDELVISLSFVSGVNQTIQVGTSPGGSNILQDVELTASQKATEIIHEQFTAAGALYFTFPGGNVTVRIKKI